MRFPHAHVQYKLKGAHVLVLPRLFDYGDKSTLDRETASRFIAVGLSFLGLADRFAAVVSGAGQALVLVRELGQRTKLPEGFAVLGQLAQVCACVCVCVCACVRCM